MSSPSSNRILNAGVVVAAFGYFVDIFDLVLFSVVRVQSLEYFGLSGEELLAQGIFLLNAQMIGMLIGGLFWGIYGDRYGRVSILFGSILMYSLATLANAFVTSMEQYVACRIVAGIGLAGELGGGITLVAESLSTQKRGYGTTIVASFGVAGALFAAWVGDAYSWQGSYIIGGVFGLLLLLSRMSVAESGIFRDLKATSVKRGSFRLLFQKRERALRYLYSILVGLPLWYVVGILFTFAPEIGRGLQMTSLPAPGRTIFYGYLGLILGDIASGLLSQWYQSRKRVMHGFIVATLLGILVLLTQRGISPETFYLLVVLLGTAIGYWAVFVTAAAEQFGTNLRATVTTTAPNFIRASIVPVAFAFQALLPALGILGSAAIVGGCCVIIALLALSQLKETFGRDLDFIEE